MSTKRMVLFHISALLMGFIGGMAGWLLLDSQVSAATDEIEAKKITVSNGQSTVTITPGLIRLTHKGGAYKTTLSSDKIVLGTNTGPDGVAVFSASTTIDMYEIKYIPRFMKDLEIPFIYPIPFNELVLSGMDIRPIPKGTPWRRKETP